MLELINKNMSLEKYVVMLILILVSRLLAR